MIGAGLAGLVAAAELVAAGKHVIVLEQEPEASFGGQAWWSFGGLFLIDSPEQRRMGVNDSHELARQDWFGSAGFDREEDEWGRAVGRGLPRTSPPARSAPGCTRRACGSSPSSAGPSAAATRRHGHGNSVPRFHITWGTGPGVARAVHQGRARRASRPGWSS